MKLNRKIIIAVIFLILSGWHISNIRNYKDIWTWALEAFFIGIFWYGFSKYDKPDNDLDINKDVGGYQKLWEAEKVVHDFGKLLEEIGKQTPNKYPALVFPKSLLPYPEYKIEKSIEIFLEHTDTKDEKAKESLRVCLVFLKQFINDEEANKRNSERLDRGKNNLI